jgi:hypothetical protein
MAGSVLVTLGGQCIRLPNVIIAPAKERAALVHDVYAVEA